jgi:hypothetical protein
VNVLVKDLGLGGKVNVEQHNDLEKTLFPGLFRKALEKEIFEALRDVYPGFLRGTYEKLHVLDGVEWLSFCFPVETHLGYSNDYVKIIIGPFMADAFQEWVIPGKIRVGLFLDIPIEHFLLRDGKNINLYKATDKNFGRRIIQLSACDDLGLIPINKPLYKDFLNGKTDEEDKAGEFCLNFGAPDELRKKHQGDYIHVAKTIAYRTAKVVQIGKPIRYDDDGHEAGNLSIIDFLIEQGVIPPP